MKSSLLLPRIIKVRRNPFTATYDVRDRLLQYGSTTFGYAASGERLSKTNGSQTTTYTYDALGNMLQVVLPDTTQVEYVLDGLGRRVGKKVGGSLVKRFLYQDDLMPVAELDGTGVLVSRFVYGSRVNIPDYMVKGGSIYRIIADNLGSPRLAVNIATGAIEQRMEFDEFGKVILDTNPGFQPFGFAGGIYDQQTKLVQFGARDYDSEAGQWTSRDPLLFMGGQTNLYAYVGNDPVNLIDPTGLQLGPLVNFFCSTGKGPYILRPGMRIARTLERMDKLGRDVEMLRNATEAGKQSARTIGEQVGKAAAEAVDKVGKPASEPHPPQWDMWRGLVAQWSQHGPSYLAKQFELWKPKIPIETFLRLLEKFPALEKLLGLPPIVPAKKPEEEPAGELVERCYWCA